MEEQVQPEIVAAVLEHEAIAGLSSHKQPVGQGGRARYIPPRRFQDELLINFLHLNSQDWIN